MLRSPALVALTAASFLFVGCGTNDSDGDGEGDRDKRSASRDKPADPRSQNAAVRKYERVVQRALAEAVHNTDGSVLRNVQCKKRSRVTLRCSGTYVPSGGANGRGYKLNVTVDSAHGSFAFRFRGPSGEAGGSGDTTPAGERPPKRPIRASAKHEELLAAFKKQDPGTAP